MDDLLALVPLALGVALLGGAIWFLLARDVGAGKWLFAALLFGHGWVHLMFLMPRTADAAGTNPFDMSRSWLISTLSVDPSVVRAVGIVLIVATMGCLGLASLATVGLVVPLSWWPALVAIGSVASAILLVVFFTPTWAIGFVMDVVLLWIVLAAVWTPTASTAVRTASG